VTEVPDHSLTLTVSLDRLAVSHSYVTVTPNVSMSTSRQAPTQQVVMAVNKLLYTIHVGVTYLACRHQAAANDSKPRLGASNGVANENLMASGSIVPSCLQHKPVGTAYQD
jgi:hypothetical protein